MIMTEGRLAYKMKLHADYYKSINPEDGVLPQKVKSGLRNRLYIGK